MDWKEIREKLKYLDPFTYVDMFLDKVNPSHNPLIDWPVQIIAAFLIALLIYSLLGFALGTGSPMVIVVSESMSPNLHRGDVVVLSGVAPEDVQAQEVTLNIPSLEGIPFSSFATFTNPTINFNDGQKIETNQGGDILVYFSNYRNEQIIHRAVAKINANDGTYILTKGDNELTNNTLDQDCGRVVGTSPQHNCITLFPISEENLQGKAIARVPYLGYVKLILVDDLQVILFGCNRPEGCPLP